MLLMDDVEGVVRRKLLAILLALMLAFGSLTACGNNEGGENNVPSSGESEDGEAGDD